MGLSVKRTLLCPKTPLFLFLFVFGWCFTPKLFAQDIIPKDKTVISINQSATNLDRVFTSIEQQSGYMFSYDKGVASKINIDKIQFKSIPLNEVLISLKKEAQLVYDVDGKNIAVRIAPHTTATLIKTAPVQKNGIVLGRIIDDENGQPLASVTVRIAGKGTSTDVDGNFRISLPEGNYTATISSVGYGTKEISEIDIKSNQAFTLNVTLKREKEQLSAVVVKGTARKEGVAALYVRQKNAATVTDGISSEQIARTPDNNVGQVLKRVSGLQTTDDNKFAVVRGLGERYNNVLLNGSQLPSSEPNRRNFAFDMIPSALVDNVVVNKTATPDLPGEFSGGIIQINTRDIPQENFFQIDIGSGYNTMSTGKDFIGLKRGRYNHLGFLDNKVHGEPKGMTFSDYNEIASKIKDNSATPEELKKAQTFLGTLPNTWQMYRFTALPVQNLGLSFGHIYTTGEKSKLGFVGALSYRNEQNINEYDLYQMQYKDYKGKENQYITTLGGNLNLGYTFGKHKISWQNIYNRRFFEKLYQFNGFDLDASGIPNMGYTSQTLVNALFQTKLQGTHGIGTKGIKVEWSGDWATLNRDQPFSRMMNARGYDSVAMELYKIPADYYNYYFGNFSSLDYGNIYYSKLKEKRYSGQASLLVPFQLLQQNQHFKIGWLGSYRKANFGSDMYRLLYTAGSPAIGEYPGIPYYEAFNSRRFEDGELYLYPISGGGQDGANGTGSGYTGTQRLNAFFGMLDLKLMAKLRLIGGIRNERYKQEVGTHMWKPGNIWEEVPVVIEKTDWLPSVNLIYALTPKINARAAWYKTVARPDIRETSGFEYFDFEIMRSVRGGNLKTTEINNADIRLEWYPAPDEVVSVSGFYKHFDNPIELRMMATSGRPWYFYENLLKAKDLGVEVDFRKSFSFINPSSIWRNLYLSGNFTLIKAEVEFNTGVATDPVTGEQVNPKRSRPLAGQSPYIINGGLAYIGERLGLNLSYNRYGRRIVYSAVDRSMDEYENPRNMMDAQISYKPLKNGRMLVRLNASNLLNQELITYINTYGPNGGPDGNYAGEPSIQRYPDDVYKLPEEQLDPKGAAYDPAYDIPVTRRRFGVSYTLTISYRF